MAVEEDTPPASKFAPPIVSAVKCDFETLKAPTPPVIALSVNPTVTEIIIFVSGWLCWLSYIFYRLFTTFNQ